MSLTSATAARRAIVVCIHQGFLEKRYLQRTLEQITDVPAPQVIEEMCHFGFLTEQGCSFSATAEREFVQGDHR